MKKIIPLSFSALAIVAWTYSNAMIENEDHHYNNEMHHHMHTHAHAHHSLKNMSIRAVQKNIAMHTHTHTHIKDMDHVNNTLPFELSRKVFEEGHTSYEQKLNMVKHSHMGHEKK